MYSLIFLMAGNGSRTEIGYNKLIYKINQREIYKYSLDNFKNSKISEVIIVTNQEDYLIVSKENPESKVVVGGSTRAESVAIGLEYVTKEYVLIHDAARVLCPPRIIDEIMTKLLSFQAVILLYKTSDSLRSLVKEEIGYLDRSTVYQLQTPISFKSEMIKSAYKNTNNIFNYLDDYHLFSDYYQEYNLKVLPGSVENFKVTYHDDILFLERILKND